MIYVLMDNDTRGYKSVVLGLFESHSLAYEHLEWYAAHSENIRRDEWKDAYSTSEHHYPFPVDHWNSFDNIFEIVPMEITA